MEENFKMEIEEMAKAGLHFGHKPSKTHPKLKPFIFGLRNNICIFDLEKTKKTLDLAIAEIKRLVSEKKVILVVGTSSQLKDLVLDFSQKHGFPYVLKRWLGGTLTNFEEIKKRIDYYKNLEREKEMGEWEKYTKKERAQKEKEVQRLKEKFEGLKTLEKIPDALFILDMGKDALAVKEAKKTKVEIIGIVDNNIDPFLAEFPIVANNHTKSSVKYILDKIGSAISQNND
jgi:small subunit ribosomal protein S2